MIAIQKLIDPTLVIPKTYWGEKVPSVVIATIRRFSSDPSGEFQLPRCKLGDPLTHEQITCRDNFVCYFIPPPWGSC
jgi:hypothetical protein